MKAPPRDDRDQGCSMAVFREVVSTTSLLPLKASANELTHSPGFPPESAKTATKTGLERHARRRTGPQPCGQAATKAGRRLDELAIRLIETEENAIRWRALAIAGWVCRGGSWSLRSSSCHLALRLSPPSSAAGPRSTARCRAPGSSMDGGNLWARQTRASKRPQQDAPTVKATNAPQWCR